MPLIKIISWNINSVRLRIGLVDKLLKEVEPDILCLQETKCKNDQFPRKVFEQAGYPHIAVYGQKGYHGVATVSNRPFAAYFSRDFCQMGDARHLATDFTIGEGLRVHNFYVPAGGDEPDRATNPKFDHKLNFVTEMEEWLSGDESERAAVLVGDFNIAPYENDVWSHKQLLKVVSHTPVETQALEAVRKRGGWVDTQRALIPEPERLFTWWSYRARNWAASNRGRRLDHIWASNQLKSAITSTKVLIHARSWDRPSDHAPIMTVFDF